MTDPVQATEALRRSEAGLAFAQAVAKMGSWEFDVGAERGFWSAEMFRLTGRPQSSGPPTFEEFLTMVHPDDRDLVNDRRVAAFTAGEESRLEFRLVRSESDIRWVESRISTIVGADQRVVRFVGTLHDVTERKQAERALRDKEQRVRSIMDSMFAFVVLLTPEGLVLEVNRSTLEAGGLRAADVLGSPLVDTYWCSHSTATQEQCRQALGRAARGEVVREDFAMRVAGGRIIVMDGTMIPLRDDSGRVMQVVASGADVTDRKHAADELKRSEENYRGLVDTMQEGLGVQDADGLITFANKRLCEMVGYTQEELLGKPASFLFEGENRRIFSEQMARRRKGERNSFEIAWRRKDGGTVHTIIAPNPRFDERGNFVGSVAVITDITERKRTEEALRETDRQLRALIANMPGFVYRCRNEKEWPVEFVSHGVHDMTGYHAEAFLSGELAFGHLVHPDHPEDADRVRNEIQQAVQERRPFQVEYRFRTQQGEEKWACEQGLGVYAGDRLLSLEGVVTDITARKLAEQALRASENRLRTILETEPECVKVVGPSGKLLEINQSGLEMLEASSFDEIRDRPLLSFVAPEYRSAFAMLHQRVVGGGSGRLEFEVVGLKGTRRWLETHEVPLREPTGEIVAVLGVTRDITERKRTEAALLESEKRLRLALDAAHMGTFDWDVPRNNITWSIWHEELWGFPPGEFGGTYEAFAERVHPDDLPAVNADIARCMAAHEPFAREFRVVRPDGSVHWVAGLGEFTFDENGQPLRMRGVVRETTERRLRDDKLKDANARLQALSRRLLEIQESERRALARELHDEIGQALTATKIHLQTLDRFPDAGVTLAARVRTATDVVDRALQQVRSLSLELRPPLLDDLGLPAALRWLVDRCTQTTGLNVTFVNDGLETRIDPAVETACFRIAQEALNNVAKHARANSLTVSAKLSQDTLHLHVCDDGIGFDAAAARLRATHGASLGLLSMEERALLAGGGIEWRSRTGHGTDVHSWFPLTGSAGEAAHSTP